MIIKEDKQMIVFNESNDNVDVIYLDDYNNSYIVGNVEDGVLKANVNIVEMLHSKHLRTIADYMENQHE
jgi:hypothetical protein